MYKNKKNFCLSVRFILGFSIGMWDYCFYNETEEALVAFCLDKRNREYVRLSSSSALLR